jgi:5-methylcytosine-specific restriction endonuclease McrA
LKGGKTKLSQQIRTSVEYSFWRMSIFKRDFFTCQHCGAKNRKGKKYMFDADHIYPFYKILDDFNITSIEEAISCEKLWDINNGRTLCVDCHKKTDTWGMNQYTQK